MLYSKPWQAALIRAMGATYTQTPPNESCVLVWEKPHMLLPKLNGRREGTPGFSQAFFAARGDGWALAQRVLARAPLGAGG
eukprot:6470283-Prymnesium_polylepis.1